MSQRKTAGLGLKLVNLVPGARRPARGRSQGRKISLALSSSSGASVTRPGSLLRGRAPSDQALGPGRWARTRSRGIQSPVGRFGRPREAGWRYHSSCETEQRIGSGPQRSSGGAANLSLVLGIALEKSFHRPCRPACPHPPGPLGRVGSGVEGTACFPSLYWITSSKPKFSRRALAACRAASLGVGCVWGRVPASAPLLSWGRSTLARPAQPSGGNWGGEAATGRDSRVQAQPVLAGPQQRSWR